MPWGHSPFFPPLAWFAPLYSLALAIAAFIDRVTCVSANFFKGSLVVMNSASEEKHRINFDPDRVWVLKQLLITLYDEGPPLLTLPDCISVCLPMHAGKTAGNFSSLVQVSMHTLHINHHSLSAF
jgi:hypothetical protein